MKKQLLTLSFAFLGAGLLLAAKPNSATQTTDSSRNYATIKKCACVAVIDGVADDAVWAAITAIPVDRKFTNETPSLYSATWKAFWTDTAIFVLVEAEDDMFYPSWRSGQADWASDKIETYFDVNNDGTGVHPDGQGPGAGGGVSKGHYQITHNFDTIEIMGSIQNGDRDSTFEANTWAYGDHSKLTVEWLVSNKALKDSNAVQFDATVTTSIGFDICVSDLDSTVPASSRQRQMWSNIGHPGEDWNNMDSAGVITFDTTQIVIGAVRPVYVSDLVTPTLVTSTITVKGDVNSVAVYNMLGQAVLVSNKSVVDLSSLKTGVYFVNVNNTSVTRIFKK
jgi:hypothetical protein